MAHGIRTIYPGGWNKGFGLKFQSLEGQSVQGLKRCGCGSGDEDNSSSNVKSEFLDVGPLSQGWSNIVFSPSGQNFCYFFSSLDIFFPFSNMEQKKLLKFL